MGDRITVYHATTEAAAVSILAEGFRDSTGSYYLVGEQLTGVFVANRPADVNDGAHGNVVLRIDLDAPEAELAPYELVHEAEADEPPLPDGLSDFREWCMPASLLNEKGTVTREE